MSYVEDKYGFKFPFDENLKLEHGQPFGCCNYQHICLQENFCIVPEGISDGKKYCEMAKRMNWKLRKAKKINIKKYYFKVERMGKHEKEIILEHRK